jgi:hypothetical protein
MFKKILELPLATFAHRRVLVAAGGAVSDSLVNRETPERPRSQSPHESERYRIAHPRNGLPKPQVRGPNPRGGAYFERVLVNR